MDYISDDALGYYDLNVMCHRGSLYKIWPRVFDALHLYLNVQSDSPEPDVIQLTQKSQWFLFLSL